MKIIIGFLSKMLTELLLEWTFTPSHIAQVKIFLLDCNDH